MHRAITLLVVLVAAFALAAPTPKKHHGVHKTSRLSGKFTVPVRGRHGRHSGQNITRNARQEIERTYRKYNWEITFVTPDGQTFSLGLPDSGSDSGSSSGSSSGNEPAAAEPSYPATTSTAAAATIYASSTTAANHAASGIATSAPPAATTGAVTGENENGEVSATPEANESEYLSPVSINGQMLDLDFDTGSSDLWVFSSSLSSSQIGGHAAFDPTKNATHWEEYEGGSWKIAYGDGSGASGTVGFAEVDVGGATATRQAVELATYISSSFVSDENNDGLLGLGFSTINTIKPVAQKTFFENIMDDLEQPVFTADLEDDAAGTYEFGTVDATKYTGDIHFTTVDTSNGFWEFDSTAYSIGGKTYQNAGASTAIADTGTSLLLVDDNVAKAFYAQIPGSKVSSTAGGYIYPCDANVPDFGVQIGNSGFIATIPGSDISFAEVGTGTCFGGVQGNGGGGIQIFGDVLLKQYFAVFNGGNNSFGVAAKSAQLNTK